MSAELISILVLVVVFVIATTRSINMGALAFAAAFGVGTLVADMKADDIFKGFPGSLFVVLVGVTFLFAIARANGTTDWLVHMAIRLVGGRIALMPWVMFAITGVLTAIGAVSPAAVAIVAPIAMGFAAKYKISPLLMGVMVVHGAQAGGFSPISIYGTIVNGIVAKEGLPGNEIVLFLASLVVNLLIAAVVFVVLGGLKLARQPLDVPALVPSGGGGDSDGDVQEERLTLTAPRIATLVGLAALVVAALVFDLDVGLAAITVAVLLSIVWPEQSKEAITQITWPTVLLICGILTYVGVLQAMGTITWAGDSVAGRRRSTDRRAADLLHRRDRVRVRLVGRHHGRAHPARRAVPAAGRRQFGRADRGTRGVGDRGRRESVLHQRRPGARRRAGRRPRQVLQAAHDLRRDHGRGGAAAGLARPRRPRNLVSHVSLLAL